jgi:hypothetical protein
MMMEIATDDEPPIIRIDASMDLLPPRPRLPGASCFSMCCKASSHDYYRQEDESTMATELLSPMSLAGTPKGGESVCLSLARLIDVNAISNALLAISLSFRHSHHG